MTNICDSLCKMKKYLRKHFMQRKLIKNTVNKKNLQIIYKFKNVKKMQNNSFKLFFLSHDFYNVLRKPRFTAS